MKNEELKKGSAVTEFDELTDEELEAVMGRNGWNMNLANVFGEQTNTATTEIDKKTLRDVINQSIGCGSGGTSSVLPLPPGAYTSLGIDGMGKSVYTASVF